MTKRQFTDEERKLTEKNLKKKKEKLENLKEYLEISELSREHIKTKRIFEDKIRPFNRKIEDEKSDEEIKGIKYTIKETEETISVTEKQLKEGVEQKTYV